MDVSNPNHAKPHTTLPFPVVDQICSNLSPSLVAFVGLVAALRLPVSFSVPFAAILLDVVVIAVFSAPRAFPLLGDSFPPYAKRGSDVELPSWVLEENFSSVGW